MLYYLQYTCIMETKRCPGCKQDLPLDSFSIDKGRKSGRQPRCKTCYSTYYKEHRAVILTRVAQRRQDKAPELKAYSKRYYEDNRDELLQQMADRHHRNPTKKITYARQYRIDHPDKVREAKACCRKRYEKLPEYRMRRNISRSVNHGLHSRGSSKAGISFFKAIGYSAKDLCTHLESLFVDEMTWDNYGTVWEVDHIIPQVRFSFTSMTDPQFQQCWALANLRPRSCSENRRAGGSIRRNHRDHIVS